MPTDTTLDPDKPPSTEKAQPQSRSSNREGELEDRRAPSKAPDRSWRWRVAGPPGSHTTRMLLAPSAGLGERPLWCLAPKDARHYLHRADAEEAARRVGGVVVDIDEIARWNNPLGGQR